MRIRRRGGFLIALGVALVVGWAALLFLGIRDFLRGDVGSGVFAAVLLGGMVVGALLAIRRHRNSRKT